MRGLVNHVVAGTLWAPPLLAGRPVHEVTGLDGDVPGDDPVGACKAAFDAGQAAFDQPGAARVEVRASFGSFSGEEYARQPLADVLVHAWDLAVATGGDPDLPGDLVDAVASWLDDTEDTLRALGAIGERVPMPSGADPQTQLLARFGRTPPP